MPPPDLPRDTPIFDVAHPAEIVVLPPFRNKPNVAGFDRFDCGIRKRLDLHIPLRREKRLHNGPASITLPDRMFVRCGIDQKTALFKKSENLFSRLQHWFALNAAQNIRFHIGKLSRVDSRVFIKNRNLIEMIPQPRFVVVEIMSQIGRASCRERV